MAFVLDPRIAGRLCELNCAHRTASGWVYAAIAPRWPLAIARQASLHTWPAYRQAIEQQLLHDDWPAVLDRLDDAGVPVTLVLGVNDHIGSHSHARRLARCHPNVDVRVIAAADHTLPAAQPELLPRLLRTR